MNFRYRARDPLGKQHDGTIEATSRDEARQLLRRDGFRVVDIDEVKAAGKINVFGPKIKKGDIIYLTAQLAIMVDTGINLSTALGSLCEEEKNTKLREMLEDMKRHVESGESFSSALSRHPKCFDLTYVSLIRAAESNGSLGPMLDRIATYQRKEVETKGKVKSAMAYPCVMALVAISVTVFLLTYIMPKFGPLFAQKGKSLPGITKFMMAASDCMIHYWFLWLAGLVGAVVGLFFFARTPRGRQTIDWIKINAPIIGPMCRKVTISRSIRTLGTMMGSGVSVLDALRLSADVSGNLYYEQLWKKVVEQVSGGNQIYETLSGNPLFPSMLVQMMRSGEETGRLDMVLEKVSNYYDGEVETSLKATTSLIEPILIVVMGTVVGTIAVALLLPIFSMGKPG